MYKRLDKEIKLEKHHGIFKKKITLFQAVALIVTGTIGAGIFSLPYAIAKVGVFLGVTYIIILGFLLLGLNLMIGEVAVRTRERMQLPGLAGKYLGKFGKILVTIITYLMGLGILVVYIIGVGQALAALTGGSQFNWSLVFFACGAVLIFLGMKALKVVDFFLSIAILAVILFIVGISTPHLEFVNFASYDLANLLFPYGIIMFAFSGVTTIPEAHSLLVNRKRDFKKAIIIAGLIIMSAYILFSVIVFGVTGAETTEIATIGLGAKVGGIVFLLGNVFAVLAMSTSFLMTGISLKDSMRWDYKMPGGLSAFFILIIPLIIFVSGMRNFIAMIDIVGGIFVSVQMIVMVLIFWQAKRKGDLKPGKYKLHHTALLGVLLLIALTIGALYSVVKLF